MATQSVRGAKRTCQNEACGARFYDLKHDPITCPVCQTVFVPPPEGASNLKPTWKTSRNAPRYTIVAPEPVEDVSGNEAAALESDETAESDDADDAEGTTEKTDLLLELDDDDDTGANGVVAEEKKD